MDRLFGFLAFVALLAALIAPVGGGVAAEEEEPPEEAAQTLVAEAVPVVEEDPPAETKLTDETEPVLEAETATDPETSIEPEQPVEEPVAESELLVEDEGAETAPAESQDSEPVITTEPAEPPEALVDETAQVAGDESQSVDSQFVEAQALESGDPDPNVSVEITGLNIDCTGAFSFSTSVEITYFRWQGHFFVDIYSGDPDAGGVAHLVFSLGDGTLSAGTATYAENFGLATGNVDPYIQIRWIATAWAGDSGLDYVGEWRGREKASAGGCETEPPTPVDTGVSNVSLNCTGLLTFTAGIDDLYLLFLQDGSTNPATIITSSGAQGFNSGTNMYQFVVDEGVYAHLAAEIRRYSVSTEPELLGTGSVNNCATSDEEPDPAPVGGPVPAEAQQLPNSQDPLSVGYQLGRSIFDPIPYFSVSNPVTTCGWQNGEYVVDINPVQVGAWGPGGAVTDQNVSIEILWAGIISGSSWFALDSASFSPTLTSESPFFTTSSVQFRSDFFHPYDGDSERADTYVIVVVDWPAGTLRFPVSVHDCDFSADPGSGGEEPVPGDEPAGNTQPGEDVLVIDQVGNVVFDDVTGAGQTTITPVGVDDVPALPDGYLRVGGQFYEIETTATFEGSARICLSYEPDAFSDVTELTLLHFSDGAWHDITNSDDHVNGVICGDVANLSPFAVVESGMTDPGAEPGTNASPDDSISSGSSHSESAGATGGSIRATAERSSEVSVTIDTLPNTGSGEASNNFGNARGALLLASLALLVLAKAARTRRMPTEQR